jgi:hypothetical protein
LDDYWSAVDFYRNFALRQAGGGAKQQRRNEALISEIGRLKTLENRTLFIGKT